MEYLMLVGGLLTLVFAGEILVRGAVELAKFWDISPLVVGLTIVAFGTSAPELMVSVSGAISGHPDISLGNIIGSNISNIALILGCTSLILPIVVNRSSITFDWPIVMISSVAFYVLALNHVMERWEGILFVAFHVGMTIYIIRKSRRENKKDKPNIPDSERKSTSFLYNLSFVAVGCVGLKFGADWLVGGGVTIAQKFGITERVIGLTIVAFGTSVPELVTSLIAAFRKESDLAVGNILGSNQFNILSVLGITSIVEEVPVAPEILSNDLYWMLGITLLLLPLMIYKRTVFRWGGAILLVTYIIYIVSIII